MTFLFVSMMALGGVPEGKHNANEIHSTTGVSTAMGDCPFAGPIRWILRILDYLLRRCDRQSRKKKQGYCRNKNIYKIESEGN